tara:strand:+ start:488 stop:718 length:231 start_codon:yes stop_codon:yes gene_type:complete
MIASLKVRVTTACHGYRLTRSVKNLDPAPYNDSAYSGDFHLGRQCDSGHRLPLGNAGGESQLVVITPRQGKLAASH